MEKRMTAGKKVVRVGAREGRDILREWEGGSRNNSSGSGGSGTVTATEWATHGEEGIGGRNRELVAEKQRWRRRKRCSNGGGDRGRDGVGGGSDKIRDGIHVGFGNGGNSGGASTVTGGQQGQRWW